MARNVDITILPNGTFDYKENGSPAKHLKHVGVGQVVHWHFTNRSAYTITFNDSSAQKNDTPFSHDPLSSAPDGKLISATVLKGKGQTFPYTVKVSNTNETDDPDIQVDDAANTKVILISMLVAAGMGFLIWKRFVDKD